MFHSARITLTAWYLIIIMTISVVFSLGFYNLASQEFQRIIRIQEFRQEHPDDIIIRPRAVIIHAPNIQDLKESDERLKSLLIVLNGIIFVLTGAAGYFLAGRTLRPIKEMVDEQHRFISDASHEMRTPLTSLRSEIEVGLRNKSLGITDARKLLKSNLEEVMSLQSLSDNLLALSQNGRVAQIMEQNVQIASCLTEAEKRLNGSLNEKKITLIKEVDDVKITAVAENIISLFVILLDNAVKYSPEGSTITVQAKKTEKGVVIMVKDDGDGIAKEDLPHIFDRFYRANKSRSKELVTGYGLGLSIAKKIITSHKGTIGVESSSGKGSTFTIHLPTK